MEQRVELAEDGLWGLHDRGRAFETHNTLTPTWNIVPYPVNPVNWFSFYNLLLNFLDNLFDHTIPDNHSTLYLHANVYSPFPVVLHLMYRFSIYEMFLFNTPAEVYFLIDRIKFRFFFVSTTAIPREEIFIENLSYRTQYTAPHYFDLQLEQ